MASTVSSTDLSIVILAAALVLLMTAGGILGATASGREWLSSRVAKVKAGRIRILDGSLVGLEVQLSTRVVLGRDPIRAQIVFPRDDTAVSRRHCEISFDPAAALFELRDLGSRNGTFIAHGTEAPRRLAPDVLELVSPGRKILVGSSRNRLVLELH
jgi:FHA domain